MARKPIDIGAIGNDGTGDSIRDAFRKVNDNFRELYSSLGLGERLQFIGLDDTPETYIGFENSLLSVNSTEEGVVFRKLIAGAGLQIDFTSNQNEITISNLLSDISGDSRPNLGGPLSAESGTVRYPIGNLLDLRNLAEIAAAKSLMQTAHGFSSASGDRLVANKGYVDTKVSLEGVNTIDPDTGAPDSRFGTMTGPLILARNPESEDDVIYDGLIAATKRYVDNAGFGSAVNLYVATSGQDDRENLDPRLQGRALPYAYKTIEAALKKAEELVLDAPLEIGPYKKKLTFAQGTNDCFLQSIDFTNGIPVNPATFDLFMSSDSIELAQGGNLYLPGDKLAIIGGSFIEPIRLQVLSVNAIPGTGGRGPISTFKLLTTGVYSVLPGSSSITTTATSATGGSTFGNGATFDITYRLNNIVVGNNGGSGYGLVSITFQGGGGGTGAAARAITVGGVVQSVSITNKGRGYTTKPNLIASLPRFFIFTGGQRTDFTGDLGSSPAALRTRDLREGLLLRGETSGALALILEHTGALSNLSGFEQSEVFDVDILQGEFLLNENISYGDVTKPIQICVFVEAGIYEENFPLRIPQNVAIIGDEFRRTIVRPRLPDPGAPLSGMSTSPWASIYFRREPTFDGMQVTEQLFGYHYLSDPTIPVYPLFNNAGDRRATAEILQLNRSFIKNQVINWITNQINTAAPGDLFEAFEYNRDLCKRDVGLIIDAMTFDLKYGGYSRTISAALKYFQSSSSIVAIGSQLSQTQAAIARINTLAQNVITNTQVTQLYTNAGVEFDPTDPDNFNTLQFPQIIDLAYVAEPNSTQTITGLTNIILDIIENSGAANYPKDNTKLDVFLCNDANIIRAVTCQGHSGFMMVLDPEGQILTKSPYCQESACFSQSTGFKTFAGGMFVDGFTGNQKFRITAAPETLPGQSFILDIDGLLRPPQTPCSFIVNDIIYRVNYIRNYNYAVDYPTTASDGLSQWYSSAQLILDETTPWTFGVFQYDQAICRRDAGLILDGVGFDVVFQTNYHQRKAGFTYRQANAQLVINDQLDITVRAIAHTHDLAVAAVPGAPGVIKSEILASAVTINTIIELGITAGPALTMTSPPGLSSNLENAKALLLANIEFIRDETIGWINAQIASNTPPFSSGFVYDSDRCSRDVGFLVEALIYDLIYGGNSQTRDAGLKYYDGVGDAITLQLAPGQEGETAAAVNRVSYLCQQVIQNLAPDFTYSATPRQTGTPASGSEASTISSLLTNVAAVITSGVGVVDALVLPNLSAYSYPTDRLAVRTALVNDRSTIQDQTIFFVNLYANEYEILMPGNRSMLSNDFTQVNDLGYGLVTANGGLTEAVSMFTYYCQISYYAQTGGQIRSIGGSSSHGNFALVAEGSDPLEVPTPAGLYHRLSEGATVYSIGSEFINNRGGGFIFVNYDDYIPLPGSELEINHSNVVTRYAVAGVALSDLATKRARINISSAGGLEFAVPHGTRVSIRQNAFVVLTGDVVDVATRPSTALILQENDFVYRVLEFSEYDSQLDLDDFQIVSIDTATGLITTNVPHRQQPGYLVTIEKISGTLPTAIVATETTPTEIEGDVYFVIADGLSATELKISTTKTGSSLNMLAGPAYTGVSKIRPYGLALTQLRENYSYISADIFRYQPFRNPSGLISGTAVPASDWITTATTYPIHTQISFTATSMPNGLAEETSYYVISADYISNNRFAVSARPPIFHSQIGIGGYNSVTQRITGLRSTANMREGQRVIAIPSITGVTAAHVGTAVTLTFASQPKFPFILQQSVTVSGFAAQPNYNGTFVITAITNTTLSYTASSAPTGTDTGGTISTPSTYGTLPTDAVIATGGIIGPTEIEITGTGGSPTSGAVAFNVEGERVDILTAGSNLSFGNLIGDQGQSQIAITKLPQVQISRIFNTEFNYEGESYTVVNYQNQQDYAILTISPTFVTSAISYISPITLKPGVIVPSDGAVGTLTIRISLVRVTSHDFLEIGTGSYADTNYPKEIFGQSVNDFNTVPLYRTDSDDEGAIVTRSQVQERDVGRVFFVTTDQYGNFSVGPFFKVDQGTGTITFSASIALSQLDGLGFKRGTTVSEFSTDDRLADEFNDTVPTEAAVAGFVARRLGTDRNGTALPNSALIPVNTGGFMPLNPPTGYAMKNNMDLGGFNIINLAQPVLGTDAARLDTINITNLKDNDGTDLFEFTNISSGQIVALTGDNNVMSNFTPVGDVVFDIQLGDSTLNIIRTDISPGVIVNTDINSSAAIEQSKLTMNSATTRANAVGITQADRGLASFDDAQFTATNGWITVKDNGLALAKLPQISTRTVLGNSTIGTANVSAITFGTVVTDGLAVRKVQYGQNGTSLGFLRRTVAPQSASQDLDSNFTTVQADANATASTLIQRDANADFAGREITADIIKLKTTSTGTYNALRTNEATSTTGFTELLGYGGGGGSVFVGIGVGAGVGNQRSLYNNDSHQFRSQNGSTVYGTLTSTGLTVGSTGSLLAITASSITVGSVNSVTAISTGAEATAGTITGRWTLVGSSRMEATYAADLAEYYEGDEEYAVGTVLIFGGDKEVTISTTSRDKRVAGVVSDTAAYSMYGACPGFKNQIALQGRVPCRVKGKISKGDLLVTSDTPGVAMASDDPKAGTIIGKAIENYDSDSVGTIVISVGRT